MTNKWYETNEKGAYFFIKLTFFLAYYLPRFLLLPIIFCVAFFYFAISKKERININKFYKNLERKYSIKPKSSFYNFFEFSQSLIDKILVWIGKIKYQDLVIKTPEVIDKFFYRANEGGIVIVSHFGNIEITKALSNHRRKLHIGILVYNENNLKFTTMLNQISSNHIKVFKVDTLDIQAMLDIQRFISDGGFIFVMGDRIPLRGNKICQINFIGEMASFPQGGFIMASLLKCKAYSLWCVKDSAKYHIWVDFLGENIKRQDINEYVSKYANLLEENCTKYPQMWFNFFDIWGENESV